MSPVPRSLIEEGKIALWEGRGADVGLERKFYPFDGFGAKFPIGWANDPKAAIKPLIS